MAKRPKTFRLSSQAVEALERLVKVTGSNETAIVEMAIARFAQFMIYEPREAEQIIEEPELPPNFSDYLTVKEVGRKRHKSKR